MQVPLHGAYRPPQRFGQRAHPRPTKAAFVVGVVREGAVGRDGLGRHSACNQVLDLRDAGKFGLRWHSRLLFLVRRCALVILDGKIHQSGGSQPKDTPRRFFYAFLTVEAYQIGEPQALTTGYRGWGRGLPSTSAPRIGAGVLIGSPVLLLPGGCPEIGPYRGSGLFHG